MTTEPPVGAFSVNPLEIEWHLHQTPFLYPKHQEADEFRGWAHVPVIPSLFQLMVACRHFPSADEAITFLMRCCEPSVRHVLEVRRRADKLYMDFARDMHAMGLLQRCTILGWVEYQKALDLGFDVDFVAGLLSQLCPVVNPDDQAVGIQAMMRLVWQDQDRWSAVKRQRRVRRGDSVWSGRTYILSNQQRRYAQAIQGCFLFGPGHINDLAEVIGTDLGLPLRQSDKQLGVQLQLWPE